MAKKKTAREIVEEQMPEFRVVESAPVAKAATQPKADATTPDLAALRKKYLGEKAAAQETKAVSEADVGGGEDSEIVLVEPKDPKARDRGAGPKAVVVSKGKIIGKQG